VAAKAIAITAPMIRNAVIPGRVGLA
jgi:hypothetical protein